MQINKQTGSFSARTLASKSLKSIITLLILQTLLSQIEQHVNYITRLVNTKLSTQEHQLPNSITQQHRLLVVPKIILAGKSLSHVNSSTLFALLRYSHNPARAATNSNVARHCRCPLQCTTFTRQWSLDIKETRRSSEIEMKKYPPHNKKQQNKSPMKCLAWPANRAISL